MNLLLTVIFVLAGNISYATDYTRTVNGSEESILLKKGRDAISPPSERGADVSEYFLEFFWGDIPPGLTPPISGMSEEFGGGNQIFFSFNKNLLKNVIFIDIYLDEVDQYGFMKGNMVRDGVPSGLSNCQIL